MDHVNCRVRMHRALTNSFTICNMSVDLAVPHHADPFRRGDSIFVQEAIEDALERFWKGWVLVDWWEL